MTELEARFTPPWQMVGAEPQTPVLVALSGGADSVALTDLLAERARRDGNAVTLLHIHHGIRGEEADHDERFCRALAERLGLAIVCLRADVPRLAEERGISLELAGRQARYRAMEQVARERGIPLAVTAHHADDNAETVLFRLCRGTGLAGLCGIPPVRPLCEGVTLVRPLLYATKREILAHCRERGLDFVTDGTNAETAYTRNRLRLEALPALEGAIPGATEAIAGLTERLRRDADCLDGLAADWLTAHREADGSLALDGFDALHPALRARVTEHFLGGLGAVHREAVERQILSGRGGCAVIPGDRLAVVSRGRLSIWQNLRGAGLDAPVPFREETLRLCDGRLTVSVRQTEKSEREEKVHTSSITLYINPTEKSAIIKKLSWRGLRQGDRLARKDRAVRCAELLRERGVPTAVRARLPVLCGADGEPIWLPFAGAGRALYLGDPPHAACLCVTVTVSDGRETDDKGDNENVRDQQGY